MKIEQLLESLPEYAPDIKLNIKNLLNSAVLTKKQTMVIFLSCAFALKNKDFYLIFEEKSQEILTESEINGSKIAGTIMNMNNIYYRFLHLVENEEYSKMPVGLRMNGISPAKHQLEIVDFELACLAISAINGCGMCLSSHEKVLKKHNVSGNIIQETIKIAASINALFTVFIQIS